MASTWLAYCSMARAFVTRSRAVSVKVFHCALLPASLTGGVRPAGRPASVIAVGHPEVSCAVIRMLVVGVGQQHDRRPEGDQDVAELTLEIDAAIGDVRQQLLGSRRARALRVRRLEGDSRQRLSRRRQLAQPIVWKTEREEVGAGHAERRHRGLAFALAPYAVAPIIGRGRTRDVGRRFHRGGKGVAAGDLDDANRASQAEDTLNQSRAAQHAIVGMRRDDHQARGPGDDELLRPGGRRLRDRRCVNEP